MKTFTTSKGAFLAVDVPTGAKYRQIFKNDLSYAHNFTDRAFTSVHVTLPPDHTYTIIGIVGELTEAQCGEIVDADIFYQFGQTDIPRNYPKNKSAMAAFLTINRIPSTHLIIKQTT